MTDRYWSVRECKCDENTGHNTTWLIEARQTTQHYKQSSLAREREALLSYTERGWHSLETVKDLLSGRARHTTGTTRRGRYRAHSHLLAWRCRLQKSTIHRVITAIPSRPVFSSGVAFVFEPLLRIEIGWAMRHHRTLFCQSRRTNPVVTCSLHPHRPCFRSVIN